jgi:hypothetical protein
MIFAKDQIVAKHLCRKIYRFFIYYDIDTNVENTIISGMAQTLINNNWNVKPVLLQLFKSDHFYDTLTMDCLIRTPMDYFLGNLRTFGIVPPNTLSTNQEYKAYYTAAGYLESLGMNPGDPPNVSGWPAYYQIPQFHQMWINSDTLPKRMRYTDALFTNSGLWTAAAPAYTFKCDVLAFAQTLSNPADPNALVDEVVKYALAIGLSQSMKDSFKMILTDNLADSYWTTAWNNYINNPGNMTYATTVQTRLRDMFTKLLRLAESHLS